MTIFYIILNKVVQLLINKSESFNSMKELVYFSNIYKVDEYDNEPLPVDIYNSEGAILKLKGQKLPKERLINAYIYHESSLSDKYTSIEDILCVPVKIKSYKLIFSR